MKIGIGLFLIVSLELFATEELSSKMENLKAVLKDLLPLISSNSEFQEKKNEEKISQLLGKMSAITHKIKTENSVTWDPSLPVIMGSLDSDIKQAELDWKNGHKERSQALIRSATNYCIACHTRSSIGPHFDLTPNVSLKGYDLANYLAATRNFERSLDEFKKLISDKKFMKENSFLWMKSVRKALLITVRYFQNPSEALKIIASIENNSNLPYFFKGDAAEWRKSLETWKKEIGSEAQTEEGHFAKLKLLFSNALAQQKYPKDHSAEIQFMRTSAELHQYLQKYSTTKSSSLPEVYYMAGISYDAIEDMELWDLSEMYFEQCVRLGHKSELSKTCFKKFEETIYNEYTGTSGTSIPPETMIRLEKLRKMAI